MVKNYRYETQQTFTFKKTIVDLICCPESNAFCCYYLEF